MVFQKIIKIDILIFLGDISLFSLQALITSYVLSYYASYLSVIIYRQKMFIHTFLCFV